MKKIKFKIIILIVIFLLSFFSFNLVYADQENSPASKLPNPLNFSTEDIPSLVASIIKIVLGFVGIIALIMFIYGGFLWMLSGGNPEKIKRGKDTFIWSVLGLIVIFFSYAIVDFIFKQISKLK